MPTVHHGNGHWFANSSSKGLTDTSWMFRSPKILIMPCSLAWSGTDPIKCVKPCSTRLIRNPSMSAATGSLMVPLMTISNIAVFTGESFQRLDPSSNAPVGRVIIRGG